MLRQNHSTCRLTFCNYVIQDSHPNTELQELSQVIGLQKKKFSNKSYSNHTQTDKYSYIRMFCFLKIIYQEVFLKKEQKNFIPVTILQSMIISILAINLKMMLACHNSFSRMPLLRVQCPRLQICGFVCMKTDDNSLTVEGVSTISMLNT